VIGDNALVIGENTLLIGLITLLIPLNIDPKLNDMKLLYIELR
jgi:hypothetical protein